VLITHGWILVGTSLLALHGLLLEMGCFCRSAGCFHPIRTKECCGLCGYPPLLEAVGHLVSILSGIGLDVPNPEKHSPQRYSSLASLVPPLALLGLGLVGFVSLVLVAASHISFTLCWTPA
jgi:hypothetical protein